MNLDSLYTKLKAFLCLKDTLKQPAPWVRELALEGLMECQQILKGMKNG
jgi:hypothetical protein